MHHRRCELFHPIIKNLEVMEIHCKLIHFTKVPQVLLKLKHCGIHLEECEVTLYNYSRS